MGLGDLLGMDVQHLVFQGGHLAQVQGDVAAHGGVPVVLRGGFVKGPGRIRPPVGQNGLMPLVRQADPADVPLIAVDVVNAAEDQPVFHRS